MNETILSESAYLDLCIAIGKYGVTPDELDDVATDYLNEGTPKEECYSRAFEKLVNLHIERRKNDGR